jgi:hypothetical protein
VKLSSVVALNWITTALAASALERTAVEFDRTCVSVQIGSSAKLQNKLNKTKRKRKNLFLLLLEIGIKIAEK